MNSDKRESKYNTVDIRNVFYKMEAVFFSPVPMPQRRMCLTYHIGLLPFQLYIMRLDYISIRWSECLTTAAFCLNKITVDILWELRYMSSHHIKGYKTYQNLKCVSVLSSCFGDGDKWNCIEWTFWPSDANKCHGPSLILVQVMVGNDFMVARQYLDI